MAALADKSCSIKACAQTEAACYTVTFTVQNLRPAPEWRRTYKPAEAHQLSGSLSPAEGCEGLGRRHCGAALNHPREIAEPQTAEEIAL